MRNLTLGVVVSMSLFNSCNNLETKQKVVRQQIDLVGHYFFLNEDSVYTELILSEDSSTTIIDDYGVTSWFRFSVIDSFLINKDNSDTIGVYNIETKAIKIQISNHEVLLHPISSLFYLTGKSDIEALEMNYTYRAEVSRVRKGFTVDNIERMELGSTRFE